MSRYKQNYTLFKRGKYWYFRTYTPDGIRTTAKTTGCKLKSEAKLYCDKLYASGTLGTSRRTFKDYAEHFFDDNSVYLLDRTEPLSYHSISSYRSSLNNQLLPYFGKFKLCDISYAELKKFRVIKMQDGMKIKTINSHMRILKIIITNAFLDNQISDNPFKYLSHLKDNTKGRDAFTLEEIKTIVDTIPEYKNITILLACTGMRRNEGGGVTLSDIKTIDGVSYIQLNKQYFLGSYKPLKTKKERFIPIIPELLSVIGESPIETFEYSAAITEIKNIFEDYEQRGVCLHSIRHFFITNAKAYGINHLVVETVAGHSLKGIEKVYTNFKPEELTPILEWQKSVFNALTEK